MSKRDPVATMIVESLAVQLASLPQQAIDECECSEGLKRAIWLARDALYAAVSEVTIEVLNRDMLEDVKQGLRELDAARRT
jgi:membrane protein YdbS with pleckstrin-like domain